MQIYHSVCVGDSYFPAADQMAGKYDDTDRNHYGCAADAACPGNHGGGYGCNCPVGGVFYNQKIFETGLDCKE